MVGVEHRGKAVYFIGICSGGAADGKEYLENPVELFGGGAFLSCYSRVYTAMRRCMLNPCSRGLPQNNWTLYWGR